MSEHLSGLAAIAKPMNEHIAHSIVRESRALRLSGAKLADFVDSAISESTAWWIERATISGVGEETIFAVADINEAQLWELVTSGLAEVTP